jgi:hypothetical protein
MERKCWIGALVLTLVAGVSVKLVSRYWPAPQAETAHVVRQAPVADEPRPFLSPPSFPAAPVSRASEWDDLHEPIITRPEPLQTLEETVTPLPTTGGVEESDVSALAAPRPDRETRHMPYADEDDPCEQIAVVVWLNAPVPAVGLRQGFLMSVPLPRQAVPDLSEESEEPPISDEALPLPSRFHPPHCPYGGHCPYPNPYR